ADGDLPVRYALQVAREVGLAKVVIDFQNGWWRQLLGDDLGRLLGPLERTVDDPCEAFWAKALAERGRLRAPERAQLEVREVTVEHPVRVLNLRVPDEE